jgi:hypothetical protein
MASLEGELGVPTPPLERGRAAFLNGLPHPGMGVRCGRSIGTTSASSAIAQATHRTPRHITTSLRPDGVPGHSQRHDHCRMIAGPGRNASCHRSAANPHQHWVPAKPLKVVSVGPFRAL